MGSIWFEKGTLDDETNSWTSWRSPDVFHGGESWWFISGIRWVSAPWRFHGETWWIDHEPWPICSMYVIFTYIWAIFGVNVSKYAIHGAYGWGWPYMFGLFFRPKFQGISPENMARNMVITNVAPSVGSWNDHEPWGLEHPTHRNSRKIHGDSENPTAHRNFEKPIVFRTWVHRSSTFQPGFRWVVAGWRWWWMTDL